MREIRKKLVILGNRSPFPKEVKNYLADLEYREWIHMNMRLSESSLTGEQIDVILRGGFIMEAAVSDCLMIDRLDELRKYIYQLTDLGAPLSETIIRDMHAILMGNNVRSAYRKSSPVLSEYGCVAMSDDYVPEAMAQLVRFAGADSTAGTLYNPLERAAALHDRLIEIYPFHEMNEMLARAVLYYVVAAAGLPLAALKLEKDAYHQLYLHYCRERNSMGLARLLEKAVLERLDLMMQLTSYEK